MKKLLWSICLLVAAALCASAQSNMGVGVDLGIAPVLEKGADMTNFGIGAKLQYGITSDIRAEADLEYWAKAKGLSVFDITVNAHYVIPVVESTFNLYPLVGLGYANLHEDIFGSNTSRFVFNVGLGGEYAITECIYATLEFKYQYIKDFSRMPIQLGIVYKF